MLKVHRWLSLTLASILVLSTVVIAGAQGDTTPSVSVDSQTIRDGTVTVEEVVAAEDGWIVIHAQAEGNFGPVIGHAPVTAGSNADVVVEVDVDMVTDYLYAMLHVDAGEIGTYEFPGPDGPVTVEGEVISPLFPVIVRGSNKIAKEAAEKRAAELAAEAEAEAAAAAAEAEAAAQEVPNIVEAAVAAENLGTLVAAIQAAGLEEALQGEGPFTVFAPTDDAFLYLPEGALESLLDDPQGALSDVLLYHVVPGAVLAADITDGMTVETLQGDLLTFSATTDSVMVNGVNIISTDITVSNGVIHLIDGVLMPAAMTETEAMTTEVEMAEEIAPSVIVEDQAVIEGSVTVAEVVAAQDGWIVIHADADGSFGPVIGHTAVIMGTNAQVVVEIDEAAATETLYAMLHVDAGEIGTYEFPGADGPVVVDGAPVSPAFIVTGLVTETAPVAETPTVTVEDQEIVDGTVTVAEVVAAEDGWIVIHAQADGSFGPVIGHTAVTAGTNSDVVVEIDEAAATETLYAMLHIDAGEIGTYEFPGADGPVVVDGAPVSPAFMAAGMSAPEPTVAPTIAPTAEPTAEPTMAATVEPTAEPTMASTVEPAATPEPPAELPQTGASLVDESNTVNVWIMSIVALIMAAGVALYRRRMA